MAVAIVAMREAFGWDAQSEGNVLGAFFYGYTCTQILGGLAARRYGGRNVLLVGVALWSLFTVLTPFAARSGMGTLLLCRVLMGLGEGVTMPSSHALIGEWLPPEERTRSVAVATTGQLLGTITAMGSSPLAAEHWPSVFYFFGALGCESSLPSHTPSNLRQLSSLLGRCVHCGCGVLLPQRARPLRGGRRQR